MILKYNIPVITEGGVPNPNNLSDEMQKIYALSIKTNRSNIGQLSYNSPTSGISYNTVDHPTEVEIYNKGETGLYNLLIKELNEYMLSAEEFNTYGTGTISTSGWVSNTGDYAYKTNVLINSATSNDIINIYIDKDSLDVANICELCATNESYDGGVTLYAKKIPSSNINFTYKF